jgi:hypothetical protein
VAGASKVPWAVEIVMWLWSRHSVDVVDMTVTRRAPAPLPNGRPEDTPADVPGLPAQPGAAPLRSRAVLLAS